MANTGTGTKLRRTGEIAKVLGKYGLDFLAYSDSKWSFLGAPKRWFGKKHDHQSQPERIRLALEELGATYVKLGQAISTRPDIVPEAYIEELAKLQDKAPEVPYAAIADVIRRELGEPPEVLFAEFDKKPLGTASIAQVHAAVLPDGTQVAVKVQKPGVEQTISEDLAVLEDIARMAAKTPQGEAHDIEGWFEEFCFTLENELDYTREGHNAERFRRNYIDDPVLVVPRVFWEYSSRRVLTIEKIVGIKINKLEELEEANIDRKRLARTCAMIVLKMIYDHGFFHADPHPGNFFVLPDGRIALLDTGMVGRLGPELRDSLMRLTLGVSERDPERLADEVMTFARARRRVLRQDLHRDIDRLLQVHMDGDTTDLSMARMLSDMLRTAADHGLILPSAMTMLARALTMCEGLGTVLDPDFNMTRFAEPYMRELLVKRYSKDSLMERAQREGVDTADVALNLPKRLRRVLGQLERGELTFVARFEEIEQLKSTMSRSANRLSMAVLMAGLIAGMSVLVLAYQPRGLAGWGNAFFAGMITLMFGAGIALLVTIWRSSR